MACGSVHPFRFGRWISVLIVWARDVVMAFLVTVDTKLVCLVFWPSFLFCVAMVALLACCEAQKFLDLAVVLSLNAKDGF